MSICFYVITTQESIFTTYRWKEVLKLMSILDIEEFGVRLDAPFDGRMTHPLYSTYTTLYDNRITKAYYQHLIVPNPNQHKFLRNSRYLYEERLSYATKEEFIGLLDYNRNIDRIDMSLGLIQPYVNLTYKNIDDKSIIISIPSLIYIIKDNFKVDNSWVKEGF